MKYQRTDSFAADYRRLPQAERERFQKAVAGFNDASDAYGEHHQPFPKALRVKPVQGAPGIFEMTWSFSGPDGRATFEWSQAESEPAVLWRRIGGHEIFKNP